PQKLNEEDDHLSSATHVSQTQEVADIDDNMNLPTQFSAPQWIKEGFANLGMQIDFNNKEVSTSKPSPPSPLPSEVVHYYANTLEWEDHDANQKDAMNSDTHSLDKGNFEANNFLANQDNQEVTCN
ncbi:hypothetical protein KI387_019632, partial [Taxus chinensis]